MRGGRSGSGGFAGGRRVFERRDDAVRSAALHIRSPISCSFLMSRTRKETQPSESSETAVRVAVSCRSGAGRTGVEENGPGATRVPQFSKVKVLRIVTDLGRTKVVLFLIGMRASRFGRGSIGAKTRVLRNRAKPSRLGESAFQISFKAAHMALAYLFKYHRENMVIVLSSGRLVRNTPRAGLGRDAEGASPSGV